MLDVEKTFDHISKNILNIEKNIPTFSQNKELILFELWTIFDLFSNYLYKKVSSSSKYKTTLIKDDFYQDVSNNKDILNSIKIKIIELLDSFSVLSDKAYLKLSREISFFEKILDILSVILDSSKKIKFIQIITIKWNDELYLEYTYLQPWEYLNKYLWNKVGTCILTSATMKIQDNFDYITRMLLLEEFKFISLDSDFNYKKQATLFIPNSLWNIKTNYSTILIFLESLFKTIKWTCLVLFTSFVSIKDTYIWLNSEMKATGINLVAQSIWWGKHKLLEAFRKSPKNSILLWTDSFWEWIDIPWESLKYLVIYKIPFPVPTDPVFIARSMLFKDSFQDYSIPKSIIKLKQWFWRLIRTKNDKWIIIFLDDRIFSTKWWKAFFSAFPSDINTKICNHEKLLEIFINIIIIL